MNFFGMGYFNDSSNLDSRFERGFLRKKVLSKLGKRYPGYIKHFAWSQNQLAKELGQSCFKKNAVTHVKSHKGKVLIYIDSDEIGPEELIFIKSKIHSLSSTSRGKMTNQLSRLRQAYYFKKSGPISFSGGVKAFVFPGAVYLFSNKEYLKQMELDEKLGVLVGKKGQELGKVKFLRENISELDFPFLISEDPWIKKNLRSLKTTHPLWPKVTAAGLKKGYWFHHLWQFKRQIKQNNRRLPLSFSFLPLV